MGSPDLESHAPLVREAALESRPPRRNLGLLLLGPLVASLLALVYFLGDKPGSSQGLGSSSGSDEDEFPWTDRMLKWHHTAFHFQPPRNFMSDPSGPIYYRGWYHFFYQHNTNAAYWGHIAWGHAATPDLLNWVHLPVAVYPDHWYDIEGDWTGSVAALPDGRVVMLFTGGVGAVGNELAQVVNVAWAADPDDPLLTRWVKQEGNPVLVSPPGIGLKDFRDPNPAWYDSSSSTWYVLVGSKNDSLSHTGIALVYTTTDFLSYTLLPGILHSVDIVGMWECTDLYPVSVSGPSTHLGLENSVPPGENVKHVLKAGLNDEWHDYYAIGTYDREGNKWTPDDESLDVGIGLRYDWGKFYASRTFYDPVKRRRVLWGYVGETDTRSVDVQKGWASVEGLPRTVLFDVKTGSNLLTWPAEEVESLRSSSKNFSNIAIAAGSTVHLDVEDANQLDIEAEFVIKKEELELAIQADVNYNCSTSDGASQRGLLGPFGLLVLANQDLSEQTATYFYVGRGTDGSLQTHLCQDELRSSKANQITKRVVGHTVPVLDDETLTLRILVDHSIVESYAQGGRASTTSRVYPTQAIYEDAKVFLFNNATGATVIAKSVKIWQMSPTSNRSHGYPGSQAL
ncbi:6(G)-fructosyltransferase-like [Asparagus officinalis]|uniref:Fructan:fructan 1-fructosyltransferase n=1 Tax=Asparagus officinalis TaxID=4686 RepID=K7ZQ02_ASPOF|nr:6(G)-fructosyltransferase-like [Asparagus officinalis]BAM66574.1 fructan:fructan 1-fructosyltransferase [Asparagus officinalis]